MSLLKTQRFFFLVLDFAHRAPVHPQAITGFSRLFHCRACLWHWLTLWPVPVPVGLLSWMTTHSNVLRESKLSLVFSLPLLLSEMDIYVHVEGVSQVCKRKKKRSPWYPIYCSTWIYYIKRGELTSWKTRKEQVSFVIHCFLDLLQGLCLFLAPWSPQSWLLATFSKK